MSFNQCTFIGNVGNPPEIRTTESGRKVAQFSLATSERWTDKASGQQKEKTDWHRIIVWNERLIGFLEKYVDKGASLLVQGPLRHRKYDKDGEDRYVSEIVIDWEGTIKFAGGKREGGGNRPPDAQDPHDGANVRDRDGGPVSHEASDLEDEIPF